MERVISSGADFIIGLSNIVPVTEAADRANFDGTIGFTNGQAADHSVFPEAEIADGSAVPANTFAITTSKPTPEQALADPGVQQCIAEYEAAFDDPLDLESTTTVQAFTNHCRTFRLMVMILEAAGVDLDPDTFVAGAESLARSTSRRWPTHTSGPTATPRAV